MQRVGEIHRCAVGGEGEAVAHADLMSGRGRRPVPAHTVQHACEVAIGSQLPHAADPEPTGGVAAPIVEAVLCARSLELEPGSKRSVFPCQPPELVLHGQQEFPGDSRRGERTGTARGGHGVVDPGRRVVAVDPASVDIDPVQALIDRAPQRTLPELGSGRKHAVDGHSSAASFCR